MASERSEISALYKAAESRNSPACPAGDFLLCFNVQSSLFHLLKNFSFSFILSIFLDVFVVSICCFHLNLECSVSYYTQENIYGGENIVFVGLTQQSEANEKTGSILAKFKESRLSSCADGLLLRTHVPFDYWISGLEFRNSS